MWGEGEGEDMAGPSTGQLRGGEGATELTVLKIAKSKIPGTPVAVGCRSEGRECL